VLHGDKHSQQQPDKDGIEEQTRQGVGVEFQQVPAGKNDTQIFCKQRRSGQAETVQYTFAPVFKGQIFHKVFGQQRSGQEHDG